MVSRLTVMHQALAQLSFSAWGLADLSGLHPLTERYPVALSLVLAYEDEMLACDHDQLSAVFEHQRSRLTGLLQSLSLALREAGVPHLTLDTEYNHADLAAPLSHKLAARRAGLGWIGKSSLLVSPEFGPRLRLATVLLPAIPAPQMPILASRCGRCRTCADRCPYGAIKGRLWHPGLARDDLLDAHLCRRKRAARPTRNGSLDPCALCMVSCPAGRPQEGRPAQVADGRQKCNRSRSSKGAHHTSRSIAARTSDSG